MRRPPLLAALLPIVLLSGALSWQAAHIQPRVPDLPVMSPKLRCTQPPTLTVAVEQQAGSVTVQEDGYGFKFWSTAWLSADLCEPGTLRLAAKGESRQEKTARLGIALGTKTLLTRNVGELEEIRLQVDKPGRLFLGFLNDSSQAENRVVFLENVALTAACHTLVIQPSERDRPFYRSGAPVLALTSEEAWTLTPCGPGQLTFLTYGEAALGEFPILRVEQDGKVLETIATTKKRRSVRLNISQQPIKLSLVNPYSKVVEDINLIVSSASFSAKGESTFQSIQLQE